MSESKRFSVGMGLLPVPEGYSREEFPKMLPARPGEDKEKDKEVVRS
jgi:hypothetical protein